MKLIRGFLMAWGCFCWIPCPYKKWNEDDRTAMVAMLPLVGTGLGLLTALVWWAVCALAGIPGALMGPVDADAVSIFPAAGAAPILCGAVVTAAYFLMTGFIHLDGFMDVSDAVMPRHPRLEDRRRILKDPHTGSFAAVSMALMLLVFAASMAALTAGLAGGGSTPMGSVLGDGASAAGGADDVQQVVRSVEAATQPGAGIHALSILHTLGPGMLAFIAVVTTSRCVSAVSVICCRPMETSQYATTDFGQGGAFPKAVPALVITALVVAACVILCLLETGGGGIMIPPGADGAGISAAGGGVQVAPAFGAGGTGGLYSAVVVLAAALVCALTAVILGRTDRQALGGMNGDISGHIITSGEMAGVLTAAILLG